MLDTWLRLMLDTPAHVVGVKRGRTKVPDRAGCPLLEAALWSACVNNLAPLPIPGAGGLIARSRAEVSGSAGRAGYQRRHWQTVRPDGGDGRCVRQALQVGVQERLRRCGVDAVLQVRPVAAVAERPRVERDERALVEQRPARVAEAD